jgi:MFS family permease
VWALTIGAVAGPQLAPVAGAALGGGRVPTLAAPFLFSVVLFGAAAAVLLLFLRPDPAAVAREELGRVGDAAADGRPDDRASGLRATLVSVLALPSARLGLTATAVGHLVMVGVMAMTPVHILGAGRDAGGTLRIVAFVLSVHIAGMYAFSPIMGWLTDRLGRRPVILGGVATLLLACGVAGTAGHDPARLAAGLTLLGLGWSATMVAGSTLLTESVPDALRASAQGLSDVTMGLAGASAGALSGLVVHWGGYPALAALAALTTLPLAALALSRTRGTLVPAGEPSRRGR